ncbi:exodeoxyribonuclease VII small subunit [[Acholeplasma] multilocale]|uniref:exodeoxyribonuclease VII small subunit n=1 Tax=[Acholeplasma] multilocale TaxID=264638 RepID=UPI000429DD6A|nr:exodeoxyribonuclease VII small subunit [[Acholeplasma] multilocale]
MENKDKNYDQLIEEIKRDTMKLSSNEITMEDAMVIFEDNLEKINLAKDRLEEYKGKINKVLADNKIEEFE